MESGVFRGGSHGELIHVGLAEDDAVFFFDEAGDGSIENSIVVCEKLRSARCFFVEDVDVVFERNWDAGEFAEFFVAGSFFVEVLGFFERSF